MRETGGSVGFKFYFVMGLTLVRVPLIFLFLAVSLEDFVVWVYPQKIVATKEHEKIVRDLIEWNKREE